MKPDEVDTLSPSDVWIMIDGYRKRVEAQMEIARIGWFYTGAYGNSDPKKFPKRVEKFHPFGWEAAETKMSAAEILERNRKLKTKASD